MTPLLADAPTLPPVTLTLVDRWPAARRGGDAGRRSLTAADARIAEALYRAQAGGASAPGPRRPRTFEQIAMRLGRIGWSRTFKELKAERLVAEQTLGHLVARWGGRGGRPDSLTAPGPESTPGVPWPAPSRTPTR